MSDFPPPQAKPERRLNYAEKQRAGLVERKKRQGIKPIAQKRVKKRREYAAWVKVAMLGQKCANCGDFAFLEPHHPFGRSGPNLFKVIPLCGPCHRWVHEFPNDAMEGGFLQPEYRNILRQPNHPQPFTLLPYP